MSFSIGYKTDLGRKRENNEDSYAVLKREELGAKLDGLFVVADGMGGGRGGDVASSTVAQALPDIVREHLRKRNGASGSLNTEEILREAIERANGQVWMQSVERGIRGMGTTCVAAVVKDANLIIGNVGDSRAYLLRDGQFSQITEDHSEVYQQVLAGKMTRDEARVSKFRNKVTKMIGLKPDVSPDLFPLTLQEGDTVLLCSDGLTTEVSDEVIARVLATIPDAQEACDRLVATALRNGGSDNITVVVLRYGKFTPVGPPDPFPAEEEDETPTDPAQDWRRNGGRRESPRPAPIEEDGEWEDEEEESALPRSRRDRRDPREESGGGNLLTVLLILLLVLVTVEAVALFVATRYRVVTTLAPPKAENPDYKQTDEKLDYNNPPITVAPLNMELKVRSTPLTVDSDDFAYVVSQHEGQIFKAKLNLRDNYKPIILASQPAALSRMTDRTALKDKDAPPAPQTYVFALDASNNRYVFNPEQKCIDKYDTTNTRITQIQKGKLNNVTAIAVDKQGSVFVIDNHLLKWMEANPPLETQRQNIEKNAESGIAPPPQ